MLYILKILSKAISLAYRTFITIHDDIIPMYRILTEHVGARYRQRSSAPTCVFRFQLRLTEFAHAELCCFVLWYVSMLVLRSVIRIADRQKELIFSFPCFSFAVREQSGREQHCRP